MIDANNPIAKLCIEGMRAEGEGRIADARALFLQAWAARSDDFEACIAAHYVARHQDSPQATLHWNQMALDYADAVRANAEGDAGGDTVGDARVDGFYPSLYLNMGWSYEQLGDVAAARVYYDRAAQQMDELPDGRYGDIVRHGVVAGRARMGQANSE